MSILKQKRAGLLRIALCGAVILAVAALAIYIPMGPRKRNLASERDVGQLRTQLKMVLDVAASETARLHSQQQLMDRIVERPPNFDLWSYLNTVLADTKLKERANLENFKPRAERQEEVQDISMAQLRLAGVSLAELIDLLHRIYSSGNLVVMYKLDSLKPASNHKGLECRITFLSPKYVRREAAIAGNNAA